MDKIIKVEKRSHYGNDLIYVVSEHKEAIEALTNKKTISLRDIENLKKLGFSFEVVQPVINL